MTLPADYQASLDTIYNYVDYERGRSVPYDETAWDLDRTRRVLAALGNPHERLSIVHVAGSKGKGSTASMIESVLRAADLATGLYTSPHLHTFRERIQTAGRLIAREDVVRLLRLCLPAIQAVPGITTFEIITVLALVHFAQQGVEWAVLEVGLGGRLDATNVVSPAVAVLTPISHEHTALLGQELSQIAREKAGIVKPGIPVVCAPQPAEALQVIEAVCQERAAPLTVVGRDWQWQDASSSLDGQTFSVLCNREDSFPSWDLEGLYTPLLGTHQLGNATTAVAVCWELASRNVPITTASLRHGLASVYWPGRLEVLRRPYRDGPALVLDSAHNEASARLLRAALERYFPGLELWLVFGASRDKDKDAMLRVLASRAAGVVTARSRHPRAADSAELALAATRAGTACALDGGTVEHALSCALEWAGSNAVVCVTGSLFVVAEGREAWLSLFPTSLQVNDWARQAEPPDPSWQVR